MCGESVTGASVCGVSVVCATEENVCMALYPYKIVSVFGAGVGVMGVRVMGVGVMGVSWV